MTSIAPIIIALLALLQIAMPRRYAFLPLIVAAAHFGDQEILPELTPARAIILVGLMRGMASGWFKGYQRGTLDKLMMFFSVVALLSAFGHKADEYFPSPFAARAGLVLNVVGAYLYGRICIPDLNSFVRYATILPVVLVPLALGMASEQATRKNPYYVLGARSMEALVREGNVRAQGPFDHAILAGTCGAAVLPFAFLVFRRGQRGYAIFTIWVCMTIVLSCASSGPLAAVAVSIAAVALWGQRAKMKILVWMAVALGLLYWVVKGRGPWFLMASLDLVGGSTGWHRARLIDQSVNFLGEWWLYGTDFTRHWMSSGVRWNPNMVDLTNYYIHLGVTGGIGLTLALVLLIIFSLRLLYGHMADLREAADPNEIILWCAGAAIAAHAMSFISISYFDQMYVFFYVLIGSVPGLVRNDMEDALQEGPL